MQEFKLSLQDIIILSTADWDNPFWTNKQHVAVQLAKRGHRIFYIDSLGLRRPSASKNDVLRIAKRLRKALRAPRQVRKNLWVWSPAVVPLQRYGVIRRFNYVVLNWLLAFWLHRLGFRKDVLWTYNPLTMDLLNCNNFDKLVYHCVDEIKAQPGMPVAILEKAENSLVEEANIVFVTAKKLFETRKEINSNTHYFHNVADFDHFSKALDSATVVPNDLEKLPRPRIGFIGAISGYKVDLTLLKYIAEKRPDWSLALIGQVGEGDPWTDLRPIAQLSNVHLLGPRSYKDLPGYLKGFDVALLPNMINEYTESMFPMKFFEYLGAGKPVVSVQLPALDDFKDVAVLAKNHDEFVDGIEKALEGDVSEIEKRISLARQFTYESRTRKMMALLQD